MSVVTLFCVIGPQLKTITGLFIRICLVHIQISSDRRFGSLHVSYDFFIFGTLVGDVRVCTGTHQCTHKHTVALLSTDLV